MPFSRSRVQVWRAAIVGLFIALALSYTLTIPLGEAYDEWAHFAYIRYVVNHHELPASGQRLVPEVAWDATHHPPLYYLFGALATSGIEMSDNLRPRPNPHLPDGYTLNAYIQGPESQWPWSGSVLGMRIARGVSMLMGALTVLLTYHIGRRLAPDRPEIALASMAIVALMPQFLFTSSIITNDIAIALLTTLAVFLSIRFIQAPSFWGVFWLMLTTLAALLTKANGVALLPSAMTLLIVMVLRRGGPFGLAKRLGLIAGGVLLLASAAGLLILWESWNTYLHGHHSSVSGAITKYILPAILGGAGQRGQILAWGILPAGLRYTYQTFWAAFGMGNIPAHGAFYIAITVMNVLALLGVGLGLLRGNGAPRRGLAAMGIIALWTLVPPTFLILSSHITDVSPGRYLMSLAPIVAIVQALGLAELAPLRRRRIVLASYVSLLLAFAIAVPWLYIRPSYVNSGRVSRSRLEEIAQPLEFRFGDALALVGYRLPEATAHPGEITEITLYWQCLGKMEEDYTISVQLLDPSLVFYGGVASYPGRGNEGTQFWEPGEIIEDRYLVRIGDDFPAPAFAMIKVEVFQHGTYAFLPLATPRGQVESGGAVFGRLRVVDPSIRQGVSGRSVGVVFGEAIALAGQHVEGAFQAGSEIAVSLRWRALAPPDQDYTVFVHLLDQSGEILAQTDGQPLAGRYPTSLWRTGDTVQDVHLITIPANLPVGAYQLAIGIYRLETLQRLAATDAGGTPLEQNQYLVPIHIAKAAGP
jgi:4-amino-4-deoxy-L-arabinose transferase-like glycosyltransferase